MAGVAEMLEACETAARVPPDRGGTEYNDWERGFLKSVGEHYAAVGCLTDKQLAKLVELWERS